MPIVSNTATNQEVEANEGTTVFDAFDQQGIILAHGCLAGSCTACCIEIVDSPEGLFPPGEVEARTLEAIKANFDNARKVEIRLSCRAKIRSNTKFKPFIR